MDNKALRYNTGKLMYQLKDPIAKREVARVYSKGGEKYEPDNWRKGQSFMESIGSLERHLEKFKLGENYDHDYDQELTDKWGLTHHLAHIAWQAEALLYQFYNKREFDDRFVNKQVFQKKQRVAMDLDGCIIDFGPSFLKHMVKIGVLTEEQASLPVYSWDDWRFRDNFHIITDDEDFWLGIEPLISHECLKFDPVVYITARPIDTAVTKEWLNRNGFPDAPVETVGMDNSKIDCLKKHSAEVFVEDRYENWEEATRAGVFTYLVTRGHNEKYTTVPNFCRLNCVSELNEFGNKL